MDSKFKKNICVAMSGGVDSSAVAYMLKKQGHNVFGLTMDLLENTSSSIKDAEIVAKKIGIPHHYLDLKKEFREYVVKYFVDSYLQGLTPTPCIMCNKEIKLGLMAKKAIELGADLIVTGHYAEVREDGLYRAKDLTKDQSYFLFAVKKEILQKLRCPLAHYTKAETRKIAEEIGLEIHKKSDSQDICFVENGKYFELIRQFHPNLKLPEGKIINTKGELLGHHQGIARYTIGQRKGLNIGGSPEPLYVTEINKEKNSVILGTREELLRKSLIINNINWLGEEKPQQLYCKVKLRSRQELIDAEINFLENDTAEVILKEPFAGIAPGQGCCFYQNTRVLGGGFIVK